jgi:small subunit ribosomal protein S7
MEVKVFGKWSTKGIEVKDPGLKAYICLEPKPLPRSRGKLSPVRFYKAKMFIVERLVTKLMVPGHSGKKHVRTSGRCTGKSFKIYKIVMDAFERVEEQTGENPIEVLVRAIENAALREEIASYQLGGIIVRRAVVTSPQRRVDLALRAIAQAAYSKSFGKKVSMAGALASELIGAWKNDPSMSIAIKERERVEKEAEVAR